MRKFFLLCLFIIGIGWALFNFKGLATQGTFDSIVLDFREDIPAAQIDSQLETISQKYNAAPRLNSEYSAADNVYIIKGDRQLLKTLRKSELAKSTEFIEPNYVYGLPEQTNVASWAAGANNRPGEAYPTLKGPNDPF